MKAGKNMNYRPLEVSLKPGESQEHLIKRFLKKVRADGILHDVLSKRFYEKPSVKRRKKRSAAIYMTQWEKNSDKK